MQLGAGRLECVVMGIRHCIHTGCSQPTNSMKKNTENIVVVLVIGPLILLDSHGSRPLSASFLIRTSGKDDSQSRA